MHEKITYNSHTTSQIKTTTILSSKEFSANLILAIILERYILYMVKDKKEQLYSKVFSHKHVITEL